MKRRNYFVLFLLFFLFCPVFSLNAGLAQDLSGQILLDVERNGEAWYIYPKDQKRYYLGRPQDAFRIMRDLGLGISELDFQKIASADMEVTGDLELAEKLAGYIILQVEKNGEAWYVNPLTLKKHYLGRPDDAFALMRDLGLGISRKNLSYIHKNTFNESINQYSSYEFKNLANVEGQDFSFDLVKIDLNNPNLKIITDSANSSDCAGPCPAKALIDYVLENKAFAGINGTYFDTSRAKLNYYFFPIYNSPHQTFINTDQLKYHSTGPIIVFDKNNKFYYFKDSRDFAGVSHFENVYQTKIQAAIGNKPRLIEEGKSLLIDWDLDNSQTNVKALRAALAYKPGTSLNDKGYIYLVVARRATVVDLAEILKTIGVQYAINLDGGYSTALYYNGEHMIGPGRNIPNVILFAE